MFGETLKFCNAYFLHLRVQNLPFQLLSKILQKLIIDIFRIFFHINSYKIVLSFSINTYHKIHTHTHTHHKTFYSSLNWIIGQIFLLLKTDSNNYTKYINKISFDFRWKICPGIRQLTNTKKAIRGNSASQWIALIRARSRDPARTLVVDSLNVSLYPASGPFCVSIYYAIARLAPFIVRGDQGKAVN